MKKNLLAAVDDSLHSRNALRYLTEMGSVVPELNITLFVVQNPLSQYLLDEAKGNARVRKEVERLKQRNREKAEKTLAEHRDFLVRAGFPEKAVRTETRPRSAGLSKDVLTFAQEGLFDALVLGRRGLSKLQEMIMGSVTAGVL
ncbi:MAG: universal stress protein, partial [Desulfobacteraceae bacterium]|nr:universal stress protein [Desulfobacteraceae bacterium]